MATPMATRSVGGASQEGLAITHKRQGYQGATPMKTKSKHLKGLKPAAKRYETSYMW